MGDGQYVDVRVVQRDFAAGLSRCGIEVVSHGTLSLDLENGVLSVVGYSLRGTRKNASVIDAISDTWTRIRRRLRPPDDLETLALEAVTTPSLGAMAALDVLADALIERRLIRLRRKSTRQVVLRAALDWAARAHLAQLMLTHCTWDAEPSDSPSNTTEKR